MKRIPSALALVFLALSGPPAWSGATPGGVPVRFDSVGRQDDPQGNLRNWWTAVADAQFKQRADVLVGVVIR